MLQLRDYRPQDFQRLLEIDQACFVEGIAYSSRELRHFLNQPSAVRIVGEKTGKIQGFVIADHFRPRNSDQRMGRIITIDVLPEARRSGLGSRLLGAVEEKIREAGAAYISLETAVDNLAALRFYKKHGYVGLKILPNYYLDSVDALLMGKKL
jgi:[ribosomal protein S18]-alanine N-acetyltransferase